MSAFEVGAVHIDALLTAGLDASRYGPLRWMWPAIDPTEDAGAFREGEPWGPEAVRLAQERSRELRRETAGRVGAMLMAENRRSVNHRYAEDEWETPYEFHALPGHFNPVIVLKAIDCYEYQSCEHPEWERSEARVFCEVLRRAMIHNLPGYDDAPGWEVYERDVFLKYVRKAS